MLFNSFEFFWFFIGVFLAYWIVFGHRLLSRNLFLIAASYLFYGWWDYRFLVLIIMSSAIDFIIGRALGRGSEPTVRRWLLRISIAANLGILGFFKYFGFFVASLDVAMGELGMSLDWPTRNIILPIGISFYTLQTLGYTIDVYRRRIEPTDDAAAFFAYVCFFPQLVAGPIERASHLLPQFHRLPRFDDRVARDGIRLVLWGFFKKVVIADQSASFADPVFASFDSQTASTILLASVYFSIQIYCDFSGYSDIAIGLSRMLGFDLMKNFDRPYFAISMSDFWHRWHISLSTWFRDYVYIPLGGSRGTRRQTFTHLWVVFTLSGLWHGAAWNYVLWGWLHFLFLVPGVYLGSRTISHATGVWVRLLHCLRILVVFGLVSYAWIFFRVAGGADSIRCALSIFDPSLFTKPNCSRIGLIWLVVLFAAEWLQGDRDHPLHLTNVPTIGRWIIYLLLLVLCLAHFRQDSPFLYFQF